MNATTTLRHEPALSEQHRSTSSTLVFMGDCLVVFLCMIIAYCLRYVLNVGVAEGGSSETDAFKYIIHYSAGFGLFFIIAQSLKLYDPNVTASAERSTIRLVKVSLFWAVMFLGASLIIKLDPLISRIFVGYSCAFMCVLLPIWRLCYIRLGRRIGFDKDLERRLVIVGCISRIEHLARNLTANPDDPYKIVGIVTSCRCSEARYFGIPVVGSLEDFEHALTAYAVDAVAVEDSELSSADTLEIARICERRFVEFNLLSGQFEVFTRCLGLKMVGTLPMLGISELPQNQVLSRILKRSLDIVGSSVGLAFTLPITPIVAYLIVRESRGPIIYKQTRSGLNGKTFTIYKFRSMKLSSEADGKARWCIRDDPRQLKIGAFMRKWNIDELPQFWNVLKGDMSLVGPRPERPELIAEFIARIPHYQSRHSVKPGMTGWAQVNGLRGDTSLEDRIRHDLQYIENWTFWLDIVIQIRTLFKGKNPY